VDEDLKAGLTALELRGEVGGDLAFPLCVQTGGASRGGGG
jgi:hypothetical protein